MNGLDEDMEMDGPDPETEKELLAEHKKWVREDTRLALRCSLKQWCKHEENFTLNWFSRVFYTLKCIFCVLIKRQRIYSPDLEKPIFLGGIVVAQHHYQKLYAGWEERTLEVGKGVFSNWWYEICTDGDWNM